MSEHTPSQAEGERDDDRNSERGDAGHEPPGTTPSQAEGEREDEDDDDEDEEDEEDTDEGPGASPGLVTRDHVRELLAAHVSALDVMSRTELVRRIGTDSPSDRELDLLAGTLNTMVAQLGA
ncbi:hypothetical protein ACIRVK_35655 [Streptomyces sp. NPDC101152]|uniref:hypothetical protein n=1 Tax=Streptomyces sp. NPDC101152 TaxID=3366116 RepID=UPI00382AEC7E